MNEQDEEVLFRAIFDIKRDIRRILLLLEEDDDEEEKDEY